MFESVGNILFLGRGEERKFKGKDNNLSGIKAFYSTKNNAAKEAFFIFALKEHQINGKVKFCIKSPLSFIKRR